MKLQNKIFFAVASLLPVVSMAQGDPVTVETAMEGAQTAVEEVLTKGAAIVLAIATAGLIIWAISVGFKWARRAAGGK